MLQFGLDIVLIFYCFHILSSNDSNQIILG